MPDTYYYAGGHRVPLLATDDVAVDLGSRTAMSMDGAARDGLRSLGRTLSSDLVLVTRTQAAEVLDVADAGVHPVYRSEDGAKLVVLPEVRVEAADPALLAAISRTVTGAHVTVQTEDRLTLVPDSGRSEDALALANSLAESGDLDLAQARFVRILTRP